MYKCVECGGYTEPGESKCSRCRENVETRIKFDIVEALDRIATALERIAERLEPEART